MKSLDFGRHLLGGLPAAAMLAGCGGSQPPIGAPGAMPAYTLRARTQNTQTQSNGVLIYASGGCGGVCVIAHPGGQLVSSITLSGPVQGECSDANGNVYVTDGTQVVEYAHGGTRPIKTLA